MRKLLLMVALAATGLLLSAGISRADTIITFTSAGVGDLGSSSITFSGLLTADGYYMDPTSGSWLPAHLFGRNQTNDHGIGVCNPLEVGSCGTGSGLGDINEVDNANQNELIRLTLPTGYQWVSVRLSSLDTNGGSPKERGQLYVDSDGTPSTTLGSIGDTVIWKFAGGGPVEPTFAIPSANEVAPYLFFEPYDWKYGTNHNNDFLVYSATIKPIPEPATLLLLGTGLAGVWLKRRKHAA